MKPFIPIAQDRIYTCEVKYEIYKGRSLLKMKPTGKFTFRPPFVVRESELSRHIFDKRVIAELKRDSFGVKCELVDSSGSVWTRVK